MKKEYCALCGSEHVTVKEKEVNVGKAPYSIVVKASVIECNDCGESFYAKKTEKELNRAFADSKRLPLGLMTSENIKHLRKIIGVTQEQFSAMLGMAPKTVARYESGSAVQSPSVDAFMRFMDRNIDSAVELASEKGFMNKKCPFEKATIYKNSKVPLRSRQYYINVPIGEANDYDCSSQLGIA